MTLASLELPGPRPWVMAHRGASDLAPENTLGAFALALEHGADLLETDLWLSGDGELVCHHDPTLRRMTGDPRRVGQLTATQLRRLHVRDETRESHEGVPRLLELLELTPLEVPVMLEIKDPAIVEPGPLDRLRRILAPRIRERRVGVLCASLQWLRRIGALAPGLVLGHIAMHDPLGARNVDLLGPWWPLLSLNPRYVEHAHRRGQRVCPLDPRLHRGDHLRRWLALDVDAVLTNDPRRTRAAIEALGGHRP
ncbi:glycerophosphodiester phosphodiesterase [Paraliomyxa miuraensis]|uniref:glycerophosphodiester phosphodiesterase n=1 Tax=Paraliomyxa miuraensis TaxID=376150 RepID=UPI0022557C62|nr:glycerophosphodiester phosphodiesterase [Paraliomyxa miuraensis]MCX4246993.1 glycerophosphodiester phosphodiesterase [Paraliomyxa miuraensis]